MRCSVSTIGGFSILLWSPMTFESLQRTPLCLSSLRLRRKRISMRPKGSAQELKRRRLQAIALLDQDMKAVGMSRALVTRRRQAV